MENQVNVLSTEKTPEQIEAEMFETRESITDKVAALENQVMGTVQNAANTLTDTVDAVKSFVATAPEAVSDTVENVVGAVKEKVEKAFDVSSRVQNNPWTSVGLSVGLGFLAGYLFSSDRKSSASAMLNPNDPPPLPKAEPHRSFDSSREPGMLDELLNMLGKKVKEMAETAIDAAAIAVNKNVRDSMPALIEGATKHLAQKYAHESTENSFDGGKRIYGR